MAVTVALCPLTGNRLFVLPVFEQGITKSWHAVHLGNGMLAVSAAGLSPPGMVNWAGLLCQKMVQPVTVSSLLAAMGGLCFGV